MTNDFEIVRYWLDQHYTFAHGHRDNESAIEALDRIEAERETDDVESYVWRNDSGEICLPAEYVRQSIILAAKFRQDPRSPRKSAMDLYKAALVSHVELASLGQKDWDYLDRRRVVVQRNAITRIRPAITEGWEATFEFMVVLPEYVAPASLYDVLALAGRTVGVGDFRPTYGRFQIVGYERVL